MFDLRECDASFFETVPTVRSFSLDLPVPAAQVWEGLSNDTPLAWCSLLSNGRYTSPRPFGAGTNREITVARMLDLREEFFRWEEGRRHSFWVMQASLPMFRRFAEDYLVEPTATGCRFTWTFALEPLPALARPSVAAGLGFAPVMASLKRCTQRHFTTSR